MRTTSTVFVLSILFASSFLANAAQAEQEKPEKQQPVDKVATVFIEWKVDFEGIVLRHPKRDEQPVLAKHDKLVGKVTVDLLSESPSQEDKAAVRKLIEKLQQQGVIRGLPVFLHQAKEPTFWFSLPRAKRTKVEGTPIADVSIKLTLSRQGVIVRQNDQLIFQHDEVNEWQSQWSGEAIGTFDSQESFEKYAARAALAIVNECRKNKIQSVQLYKRIRGQKRQYWAGVSFSWNFPEPSQ